jgi:hypothetical protein
MTCKFGNHFAISALLCGGAVSWGQEATAVRMNATAKIQMTEEGFVGKKDMKPSRTFSGTVLKPAGDRPEGLQGHAAMKPAQTATADSRTDVVRIHQARAAQFGPVTDGHATNTRIAEPAAKAHANDAFDPRAMLTTPPDGATVGATQLFAWTTGTAVSQYYLWVGSCQDCTDLLNESEGLRLSRTINLPADGRLIYLTLFSYIGGSWYWVDYEFVASSGTTPAFLISPVNGATLDNPQSFVWTTGVNITDYYLWLGSCQDCNDLLNEDEGINLSRTVNLPLDGRTIFATLFSYSQGTWYWVDYQFRAGTGNPVRVFVTNDLAYPLNIFINGTSVGSVNPFQTQYADAVVGSMTVSFQLAAPTLNGRALGDNFAGYFSQIDNASGTYNFEVNNYIGTSEYFMPEITNPTPVAIEMAVNGGLTPENKCYCVVGADSANVAFGYYQMFLNSNVRGFVNGANYSGPYIYWGEDANGNIAQSGLLYKLAAANSGIVRLTATSAP